MTDNRPLCSKCKSRPSAFNYKKGDKTYYRKMCDKCIRLSKGKGISSMATWQQHGYKKKAICEKCGFKAKHHAQLDVYHIDGDLRNSAVNNLLALQYDPTHLHVYQYLIIAVQQTNHFLVLVWLIQSNVDLLHVLL